jgi:hypothetical protein
MPTNPAILSYCIHRGSRDANSARDANKANSFALFGGNIACPIIGESKMQKTEINSAIAETLPAVESINGVAIATVEATIKEIGFASQKETAKIVKSKGELDRLNTNLLGWIAQLDAEGKVMRFPDDHPNLHLKRSYQLSMTIL